MYKKGTLELTLVISEANTCPIEFTRDQRTPISKPRIVENDGEDFISLVSILRLTT